MSRGQERQTTGLAVASMCVLTLHGVSAQMPDRGRSARSDAARACAKSGRSTCRRERSRLRPDSEACCRTRPSATHARVRARRWMSSSWSRRTFRSAAGRVCSGGPPIRRLAREPPAPTRVVWRSRLASDSRSPTCCWLRSTPRPAPRAGRAHRSGAGAQNPRGRRGGLALRPAPGRAGSRRPRGGPRHVRGRAPGRPGAARVVLRARDTAGEPDRIGGPDAVGTGSPHSGIC